ncbi:MAG: TIGR01777 family oxidoreductase [Bryobacteraceae bacterium]|nr:TIGR01777 family oxidoreductase [Bryobacteraceae bacterium]
MKIAVTGATGLVGRQLIAALVADGRAVRALARRPAAFPPTVTFAPWDTLQGPPPETALQDLDAIVHLAGEPVAQRWTPEVKQRIRASRVDGTRRLVESLSTISARPSVLVSASAIGYYGDRGDKTLTEDAKPGAGFLPETCVEWERTADLAESLGIRVVKLRIGVVLDPRGGALEKMLPPFRAGVGGRLGSGRQWMSWIHRQDLIRLIRFAIDTPTLRGPVNATAPHPETNAAFSATLGRALHRPAILPAPALAVKLMFGEMAEVVLASQRVLPQVATAAGFTFQFPTLAPALADLFPG